MFLCFYLFMLLIKGFLHDLIVVLLDFLNFELIEVGKLLITF